MLARPQRDAAKAVTSAAAGVYRRFALSAVPRLLGTLDRDPLSLTAGSFDRDHWAWKFRDAPVMTLQVAIAPLAMLWSESWTDNPWTHNTRLLSWLELAIRETVGRQARHGGFETIGPNTFDHGVTLAMCHTLSSALLAIGDAVSAQVRDLAVDCVRRGCAFARRTREDYAFISNHQALFALSYYRSHQLLGDPTLQAAGDASVLEILRRQSPDGWYPEYGGPDPGYETLGLHYLALCWQESGNHELLGSISRSASFLAHCVHPDGSVGGVYGSRQTALYYPGGLEILAEEIPAAAGITRFLIDRLDRNNVLTPNSSDPENLATLMMSYLEAATACGNRNADVRAIALPCEELDGVVHFEQAGITVAGSPRYYAVANADKGGVCRVFDKRKASVVYEDAGYIIVEGGRWWSSQLLGCGRQRPSDDARESLVVAQFARVKQARLTPGRFAILRLLNFTVFRSLVLGAMVRRRVIARLITSKEVSDRFLLERTFRFLKDRVLVHDVIRVPRSARVTSIWRPRSFTPFHMGSANYFASHEAAETLSFAADSVLAPLQRSGIAEQQFAIIFPDDGPSTLQPGNPDEGDA